MFFFICCLPFLFLSHLNICWNGGAVGQCSRRSSIGQLGSVVAATAVLLWLHWGRRLRTLLDVGDDADTEDELLAESGTKLKKLKN
jgi:hypothetical protein